jgi:hypothetical protein
MLAAALAAPVRLGNAEFHGHLIHLRTQEKATFNTSSSVIWNFDIGLSFGVSLRKFCRSAVTVIAFNEAICVYKQDAAPAQTNSTCIAHS